ncbi:MAG: MoxR family ATPase, partial [Candidatus Cryosericum sp.]
KHEQVLLALVPMIAGGHLLLQDVPGVGKSTLAQALGQSIGASYSRIQFTSDLLPADILGVNVFEAVTGEFRFRRGPIFANVVMADEINRASPKTQSALLEAMNDRRVSIDGTTWDLPEPFFVIATQNPVEYAGTYPLPESELDRFQLCMGIGYPDTEAERRILTERPVRQRVVRLDPVASVEEVLEVQDAVDRVTVAPAILNYLLAFVQATRGEELFEVGVSPRGSIDLLRAVRAWALLQGRVFVVPDDIKTMAPYVVAHRIVRRGSRKGASRSDVNHIFEQVPAPA